MSSKSRRETGQLGEEMACRMLRSRGYQIVMRNWRCPEGEIDIVAQDGECWTFVEVKTRHGHAFGTPEEALSAHKAAQVMQLAQIYLSEHAVESVDWRIDLVAIELDRYDAVQRMSLTTGIS